MPNPPPPVDYAAPAPPATRGQFRVLLVLTFVNTVLMGLYVIGPGLTPFVTAQWAAYQQRQAAKVQAQQQLVARTAVVAAQAPCLTYAAPAGTLVYAEDDEGAAQLTKAGGRQAEIDGTPPPPAAVPVLAPDPPCLAAMPAAVPGFGLAWGHPTNSVVFVHGLRATPTSPQRLVVVDLDVEQHWGSVETSASKQRTVNHAPDTMRRLIAVTVDPATPQGDMKKLQYTTVNLHSSADAATLLTETSASNAPPVWTADVRGQLRLFAALPDPADASRFVLPYSFDGTRGDIVGRLLPSDLVVFDVSGPLAALRVSFSSNRTLRVPLPTERRATGRPTTTTRSMPTP